MTNVTVIGAGGRMGREIIVQLVQDPQTQLTGAVETSNFTNLGIDAGTNSGLEPLDIEIAARLDPCLVSSDVIIDFSSPESVISNIQRSVDGNCGVVVGTTGLSNNEKSEIESIASRGGKIVFAPNMSVGVNVLFNICKHVQNALGQDYDIEVIEMHHRHKKDAPSGTAAKLAEILAFENSDDRSFTLVHGRNGNIGARNDKEIGIHALRGGDVVGDHTVIFAGDGERIELTHRASSRATFARGAVRAAKFIHQSPPGLYDMTAVLGLK